MTNSKTFWQTTFVFTFLANLAVLGWSIARWNELGVILQRSVWGAVLLMYLSVLTGCIFLFFWMRNSKAEKFIAALELSHLQSPVWRALGLGLFTGILLLIPYLKFTFRVGEVVKKSTQDPVLTTILFYWACWWLILLAAGALKVAFKTSWQGGFASTLIILGVAYELYNRFQAVTTYPFSMGWSETSRYFYASLLFSKSLYGELLPLSALHPSRYILQSLAFLVPNLDLTGHRFWQFLLWPLMTSLTVFALSKRALIPDSQSSASKLGNRDWLLMGWLFLFYLLVGVYYHLMPMVFIPLLFVSHKHRWRSLVAIVVASAWAGISRVNWIPMPAMIAIAIYLLEVPFGRKTEDAGQGASVSGISSFVRYLSLPALWTISGLLSALGAQAAYIILSGNAGNADAFASSFSSALLWDRLWPNELYPLGVFWGILIVSGPLLAVLALALNQWGRLHPIRWVGILSMLSILFAGGLVVSVKIGGGGDLHNMDGYAVLLSIVTALFIGGQVKAESAPETDRVQVQPKWPVIAVAALIPVLFLIPALSPREKYNQGWNQDRFDEIKALVEGANGPVLFINERHFVTFGNINVALVPEYENVSLMEMAMSNNQQVLGQFYSDLRENRFAMIVAGKQNLFIKEEGAFAEENNAWNELVSPYILCYYEPIALIEPDHSRLEVFVPRAEPGVCP
ncbi:MAG: hypothetical protein CVU44_13125 [Chloroflexi bacterium HGW-Chloroflexi-6]|nr:MAG: hypothetical protein CVU44_13125 [Chloroflexi bacterium HGW-Chloroflexi-6]